MESTNQFLGREGVARESEETLEREGVLEREKPERDLAKGGMDSEVPSSVLSAEVKETMDCSLPFANLGIAEGLQNLPLAEEAMEVTETELVPSAKKIVASIDTFIDPQGQSSEAVAELDKALAEESSPPAKPSLVVALPLAKVAKGIPDAYFHELRKEQLEEQKRRAGRGKKTKKYNLNRQWTKDDVVFASDIRGEPDEEYKAVGVVYLDREAKPASVLPPSAKPASVLRPSAEPAPKPPVLPPVPSSRELRKRKEEEILKREKERRVKERRERELLRKEEQRGREKERRLKEARERAERKKKEDQLKIENERKMREVIETEERKKREDQLRSVENERRLKEARQREERKKREEQLKVENERRWKEAMEWEESRKREEQVRAEEERRIREDREREEQRKREEEEKQRWAAQARDRENRQKNRLLNPHYDKNGYKIRGCQFGGLTPVKFDPQLDPRPGLCFWCWQPGHGHNRCQEKGRQWKTVCFNCGRRNRTYLTCERCKEAHQAYLRRKAQTSLQSHTPVSRREEPGTSTNRSRSRSRSRDRFNSHPGSANFPQAGLASTQNEHPLAAGATDPVLEILRAAEKVPEQYKAGLYAYAMKIAAEKK